MWWEAAKLEIFRKENVSKELDRNWLNTTNNEYGQYSCHRVFITSRANTRWRESFETKGAVGDDRWGWRSVYESGRVLVNPSPPVRRWLISKWELGTGGPSASGQKSSSDYGEVLCTGWEILPGSLHDTPYTHTLLQGLSKATWSITPGVTADIAVWPLYAECAARSLKEAELTAWWIVPYVPDRERERACCHIM